MSFGTTPEAGGIPSAAQALIFSGDGVAALSAEAIEELRLHAMELTGGLSVEAITVANMASVEGHISAEQELAPVPVTRAQMIAFAVEHGYPDRRGAVAWLCVGFTRARQGAESRHHPENPNAYPIRYLDDSPFEQMMLDLRSVHARLMGTGLSIDAWVRGTSGKVKFLAHMVNEVVQPEELLVFGRL